MAHTHDAATLAMDDGYQMPSLPPAQIVPVMLVDDIVPYQMCKTRCFLCGMTGEGSQRGIRCASHRWPKDGLLLDLLQAIFTIWPSATGSMTNSKKGAGTMTLFEISDELAAIEELLTQNDGEITDDAAGRNARRGLTRSAMPATPSSTTTAG
jgi:hypothetical protein